MRDLSIQSIYAPSLARIAAFFPGVHRLSISEVRNVLKAHPYHFHACGARQNRLPKHFDWKGVFALRFLDSLDLSVMEGDFAGVKTALGALFVRQVALRFTGMQIPFDISSVLHEGKIREPLHLFIEIGSVWLRKPSRS